jgi:hypothetical protein
MEEQLRLRLLAIATEITIPCCNPAVYPVQRGVAAAAHALRGGLDNGRGFTLTEVVLMGRRNRAWGAMWT